MENTGVCLICQQSCSDIIMLNHLQDCIKHNSLFNSKNFARKIFRIKMASYCNKFWLYLDVSAYAKLQDLDDFLRIIWVECCNHASTFYIENIGVCAMKETFNNIFIKGSCFSYKYDFGNPTQLLGKVVAWRQGSINNKVKLLARNKMPQFECSNCSSIANVICRDCNCYWCNECIKNINCHEEDDLLPIVNSPRTGVCGYAEIAEENKLKIFLP